MSLLTLLFKSLAGAAGVPTQIGLLTVDVTIDETHELSAQVTNWPIEGGSLISDHVRLEPRSLTISGFVSDTPLFLDSVSIGNGRSMTTFALLEQMWKARVPMIVVSQLKYYDSMVIEHITIPKTRESALRFNCKLREIVTVTGQNALLPANDSSASSTPGSSGGGIGDLTRGNVSDVTNSVGVDAGRQTAADASGADAAGAKSWAATMWDAF